jgi:hypothetical protein
MPSKDRRKKEEKNQQQQQQRREKEEDAAQDKKPAPAISEDRQGRGAEEHRWVHFLFAIFHSPLIH